MEPIEIPPLCANDSAVRLLLPQSVEADEVLDNGDCSKQRSANAEDGVGRQLVARQAIPHAKVKADGHEDTVEDDEGPEPEDGLLSRTQRVLERWRPSEVGVVVCDLCVRVPSVQAWRGCSTRVCAGCCEGRSRAVCAGAARFCAARLAFIVVAHAIDVNSWHLQRVGIGSLRP